LPPASASLFSRVLKILILQDVLRSGGTERQSIVLTKGLLANGLDAQLVTFRPGGALAASALGLPGRALQKPDRGWDWYTPGLAAKLRQEQPDFVLAMGRMANCRLGWLNAGQAQKIATFRTGKPLPYLYRRALRTSQQVIVNSGEAADTLTDRYGIPADRITVIYNGLVFPAVPPTPVGERNTLRQQFGAGPQTTVFICVAMLRPEKMQSELLEILAGLLGRDGLQAQPPGLDRPNESTRGNESTQSSDAEQSRQPPQGHVPQPGHQTQSHQPFSESLQDLQQGKGAKDEQHRQNAPDWQLWLVGDGPTRGALEQRAREPGLADRVKFLGFQADPSPFYAAADVAVHASASEALSNFLIEAQAHGLPVVAYDAQGIAECLIPGQTGWIIRRDDRAGFRSAALRLMNAPQADQTKLRSAAAQFARDRFDADRQILAYVHLLRRLQSGASS